MANQNVTLGVDLGTTNSAVAIVEGGEAEILENREGDRTTPSVVRFSESGDHEDATIVGTQARNRAMEQPDRTISSIKRHMGEEDYTVNIDGVDYKPEEISGHILSKLRSDTADRLALNESSLASIVVTVPAYFTEDSRQSTRDAAKIAGFENIEIINEPSASAMAYGYRKSADRETVLVYDLGGGTFDVSILTIGDGMFEVKATNGIRDLGGDDWDERIVEWLRNQFQEKHESDPLDGYDSYEAIKETEDLELMRRHQELYNEARARKKELATQEGGRVPIYLPHLVESGDGLKGFKAELSHHEFQDITEDLIQQTVDPMLDTIDEAGFKANEIDEVLLVGGSTRMKQVEEIIRNTLNQEPNRSVNPDEAVAQGAAIKGNQDDVLLQEVTPLSLGIGVKSGAFERVIPRNSTLPAEGEKMFTTTEDGHTNIKIDVFQGEREIASENRHLKQFYLNGLPPQPRGMASIEVTFRVSRTGLVTARAEDIQAGSEKRAEEVTIEGTNNLSDNEINRMIQKAEEKEEEDERQRRLIEKREEAKRKVNQAENMLASYGDLIADEKAGQLDQQKNRVQNALEDQSTTVSELDDRVEKLEEFILEAGEEAGLKEQERSPDPTDRREGTSEQSGAITTNETADRSRTASSSEPEQDRQNESEDTSAAVPADSGESNPSADDSPKVEAQHPPSTNTPSPSTNKSDDEGSGVDQTTTTGSDPESDVDGHSSAENPQGEGRSNSAPASANDHESSVETADGATTEQQSEDHNQVDEPRHKGSDDSETSQSGEDNNRTQPPNVSYDMAEGEYSTTGESADSRAGASDEASGEVGEGKESSLTGAKETTSAAGSTPAETADNGSNGGTASETADTGMESEAASVGSGQADLSGETVDPDRPDNGDNEENAGGETEQQPVQGEHESEKEAEEKGGQRGEQATLEGDSRKSDIEKEPVESGPEPTDREKNSESGTEDENAEEETENADSEDEGQDTGTSGFPTSVERG